MNIEPAILKIIEQGKTEDSLFFLPDQQLDRKTYLNVNKVLECLGGKWNRKFKAHIFESDISGAIDDVLLTGQVINKKQEFQFFETPPDVVSQLIKLAEVKLGHKCLEPSAGQGNIAESLRKIAGENMVACVELMPENVVVLMNKGFHVHGGDFLQYVPDTKYERIVMNPPFTRQQDIIHVEKALSCLSDNGILVTVMSNGVTFRHDNRTLGFWKNIKNYKYEIIELPAGAFKVAGTGVNTIILKIIV